LLLLVGIIGTVSCCFRSIGSLNFSTESSAVPVTASHRWTLNMSSDVTKSVDTVATLARIGAVRASHWMIAPPELAIVR
jgi:hypothetical protein